MKVQKWNSKTRNYEPYDLPEGCLFYSEDLTKISPCCQCGKKKEFGEMFTSKEVHTQIGLSYPVCEDCYELEVERSEK